MWASAVFQKVTLRKEREGVKDREGSKEMPGGIQQSNYPAVLT